MILYYLDDIEEEREFTESYLLVMNLSFIIRRNRNQLCSVSDS